MNIHEFVSSSIICVATLQVLEFRWRRGASLVAPRPPAKMGGRRDRRRVSLGTSIVDVVHLRTVRSIRIPCGKVRRREEEDDDDDGQGGRSDRHGLILRWCYTAMLMLDCGRWRIKYEWGDGRRKNGLGAVFKALGSRREAQMRLNFTFLRAKWNRRHHAQQGAARCVDREFVGLETLMGCNCTMF